MAAFERDPLRRLGRLFQFRSVKPAPEAEVDEEIDFHLRRVEEELVTEGMTREQARAEAIRRFGDPDKHRRQLRRINRRRGAWESLLGVSRTLADSLRGAVRALRAAPAVTGLVVVTLALGIGANAVMFGIIDQLLLQPPAHVVDPDSVVRFHVQRRNFADLTVVRDAVTWPDYRDWTASDAFSSVAAINDSTIEVTLGDGADAGRVPARFTTPSLFPLLGVRPALGRFYNDDEDVVGAADLVVLGHDLWRSRFGSDPGVIGRTIPIAGVEHRVIGVAPKGFTGFDKQPVDLWLPLRSSASDDDPAFWETGRSPRGYWFLRVVGRLAPDSGREAAAAEATALHRGGRADIEDYDPEATVLLGPVIADRGVQRSAESVVARWLLAVSGIVLVVACANVANMLLARGLQRRREIGVRLALGISGRRLAGDLIVESLLQAMLAGCAALLLVWQGASLLRSVLLPDIYWGDGALDGRVLAFTFGVAFVTGTLAGLLPALHTRRQDVVSVLGGGARTGAPQHSRLRLTMLVVQTALSVALLIGAGLFVRSLRAVESIDMGFEPAGLLVAFPEIDREELDFEARGAFYREAVRRVRALPAVESATTSMTVPFHSGMMADLQVPDVPEPPEFTRGGPYINVIGQDWFRTLGIELLEGRLIGDDDGEGAPPVAVVNAVMADAYWPEASALGRCLRISGGEDEPCRTVVGVVERSAHQDLMPAEVPQYYVPMEQVTAAPTALLARVDPERVDELAAAVQREVRGGTLGVRFVKVQPLRALIDPEARSWRLGATLFTIFGLLALVIAAVGLYGVISFSIARRRHEIGVRAALGAAPGRILRAVVLRAVAVVAGSVVIGTLLALAASPWLEPQLFGVSATDPLVFALVAIALLAVSVLAGLLPALRASGVDPARTLHAE